MVGYAVLWGPGNLSVLAKVEKIIGVFAFLAPVELHQNQFLATLWRGQPQNSLNDQQSINHGRDR
ncbi:replication protein RepA [Escherichia coli]|nr:replication protein RepA [Escherichia coli]EFC1876838.1 replication protein RepA [Escherichia coli]